MFDFSTDKSLIKLDLDTIKMNMIADQMLVFAPKGIKWEIK